MQSFDYSNPLPVLSAAILEFTRTSRNNRSPSQVRLCPKAFAAVKNAISHGFVVTSDNQFMGVSFVADADLGTGPCPQILAVDGEEPKAGTTTCILRTRCRCEQEMPAESHCDRVRVSMPTGGKGWYSAFDYRTFVFNGLCRQDGKRVFVEEIAEAPDREGVAARVEAKVRAECVTKAQYEELKVQLQAVEFDRDQLDDTNKVQHASINNLQAERDRLLKTVGRLTDELHQRDVHTLAAATYAEARGRVDSICSSCGGTPAPHVTHYSGVLCAACAKKYGAGKLRKAGAEKAPGRIARARAWVNEKPWAAGIAWGLAGGVAVYEVMGNLPALMEAFR